MRSGGAFPLPPLLLVLPAVIAAAAAAASGSLRHLREVEVVAAAVPLAPGDLDVIRSVDCLKIRQRFGPQAPCDGSAVRATTPPPASRPAPASSSGNVALSVATYPHWRDQVCRSNGELFCDPEGLLNASARGAILHQLQSFREGFQLTCGRLDAKLGDGGEHPRPFHLAVAIAADWPESESDADTIQKFGQMLLAQWGVLPWYNGVDIGHGVSDVVSWHEYTANCPNAAALVILPRYRAAYLVAPSCEFICAERGGGADVNAAMEAALESGAGVAAAVSAGISTTWQALQHASPMSLTVKQPENMRAKRKHLLKMELHLLGSENFWFFLLRAIVVLVVLAVGAGVGTMVYVSLAPRRDEDEKALRGGTFVL